MKSNDRITSLDALRGIASMGVCLCHLTASALLNGNLKNFFGHGNQGVPMFFVISGFIIPFTLWKSQYQIGDYGRYLLKRITRLDPPYLVAIILIIPLGYLSAAAPGYKGPPFHVTIPQILLHLGYLNVFFGLPWINGVFWTLAIEFQYYLLMWLAFFFIVSPNLFVRFGLFIFFGIMAFAFPVDIFYRIGCLFLCLGC
jgi:peptidoglycan/LPS O-acetylase OafA/YrhL